MEGLSGEGTRRRKEYTENTEVMEPTVADIERAKERALERIDASRDSEVSARENADQIVQEILEEEKKEEDITTGSEESLEDLERMEEFRESIERRKEKALEKIDLQGTEEDTEIREPDFGEIRSKEEFDRAVESHSEQEFRESHENGEKITSAYTESLEHCKETEKVDTVEDVESLEKPEKQETVSEAPSRLQELDGEWARSVISDLDSREWNRENLAEQLSEISNNLPDSSRTFYVDIEKSLGLSLEEMDSFEQAFQQVREKLDEGDSVRFGLVGERLYVWKPDLDSTGLENVYDSLYYYFRDKPTFDKYVEDAGESIGLQDRGQSEILKHLQELAPQMVVEETKDYCFNPRLQRIRGDYVNLINDMSGKTLSNLEGKISKITGYNGHGGIEKPLYPQGEKLNVAIARIAAVVFSDGTIEPNGVIKYAEPNINRIERVVENVRKFGDINPSSKQIEGENHYITHLPFVIGKILMSREIPSGDRTIQNPRLSSSIREGTDEVKRAYIEDFTPQDACVGNKTIIWRRVNALHAGDKTERWDFEPQVGLDETNLIKEYGRKASGNAESWALSWGKLSKLAEDPNDLIAHTADSLQQAIHNNPNRLMDDEAKIIREMGIDIEVKPSDVRYYPRTGRVSVVWQAYTTGTKEAIKLGIVTSPNDINNREKVRKMITNNSRETEEAIVDLRNKGIEFKKWWESE